MSNVSQINFDPETDLITVYIDGEQQHQTPHNDPTSRPPAKRVYTKAILMLFETMYYNIFFSSLKCRPN